MARIKIAEFGIIQKSLASASVAIYEADANGVSTGTLATLYSASSGTTTISNPQVLNADGKLANAVWVDSADLNDGVMAQISNINATTERLIKKITVNPLEYALPMTSSSVASLSVTAQGVADALDFDWKAAWATSTVYADKNMVKNNGSSYICKLDNTSAATSEPGVGATWTTYWDTLAEKGTAGVGSGDMLAANNLSDVANAGSSRANLGLAIGTDIQAYDADLLAIAGLTSAANKIPYFTGVETAGVLDFRDEDDMAADGATSIPSQQSLKAFVENKANNPFSKQLLHITHETTGTTAGGTATSGSWLIRPLNTIKTNEITGATLTTNVISLPAGTYWAEFDGMFVVTSRIQHRLRDTTGNATLAVGLKALTGSTSNMSVGAPGSGRFTLSATTNVELQYRVSTTRATDGLGQAVNDFSEVNVFAGVKIWKVA